MSRAREVSKIAISLEGIDFTQLVSNLEFIDTENIINTASSAAISSIVDGAPEALNTLLELSAALNDDPNFYTTIDSVYQKIIPYSNTTPESPSQGDLWVDSSTAPPALKTYDGSNWVQLGAAVDDSQAIIAGRMFA